LNALDVEPENLYSAWDAHAEIQAILPDIEAALAQVGEDGMPLKSKESVAPKPLPVPVCSIVGDVLGLYIFHHKSLEALFYSAGAVGEVPQGNCVTKCQEWLKRLHKEVAVPTAVLGKVLEEFMEVDNAYKAEEQEPGRKKIREVLGRFGLSYHTGGLLLGATNALPTKSLTQVLKDRELPEVDKEFERALANVESDPPASITAACSILESLFKVYIEDNKDVEMPTDQSIKPLWKTVSKHLGFDPSVVEDEDLKKILSGMTLLSMG
jgi:hypothetical protein